MISFNPHVTSAHLCNPYFGFYTMDELSSREGLVPADVEEEDETREPPTLVLRGPSKIVAAASSTAAPYALCPADAPADLVCDFGVASAEDEEEGSLLSVVSACHPDSIVSVSGLAACTHVKLDTPGTYSVAYSVSNSDVRSQHVPVLHTRFCSRFKSSDPVVVVSLVFEHKSTTVGTDGVCK